MSAPWLFLYKIRVIWGGGTLGECSLSLLSTHGLMFNSEPRDGKALGWSHTAQKG